MTNDNFVETGNPYQATIIDETPVEMVRFFHAEPTPQKIFAAPLKDAVHFAFMQHKFVFSVLGLIFFLFNILSVGIMIFLSFIIYPNSHFWFPTIPFLGIYLIGMLIYILFNEISFKILRKEPIFNAPSREKFFQMFFILGHGIFYLLILGTVFLAIIAICFGISYALSPLLQGFDLTPLIVIVVSLVVGIIFAERLAFGIHFIIDRKMDCITAIKESWRFTKGNLRELQKAKGLASINWTYIFYLIITCGLAIVVVIGHSFCRQCVMYFMLTGQCELVSQLPDEW